ncbi:MAG TPA: galactokinase, partial [bacterium]|nr:galactokinase [bacterium]
AGFGGCTVSIVHKSAIDDFKRYVGENYRLKTGLTPDFYVMETGEGAREIC